MPALAGLLLSGCIIEDRPCSGPRPSDGCASWSDCELDARDATCGGPVYECNAESGAWVVGGYCEPGFIQVRGDVTFHVSVGAATTPDCPVIEPRDPIVVTGDRDGAFSAVLPLAVTEVELDLSRRPASGFFGLADEWLVDGVPAAISLGLSVDLDDAGVIGGVGNAGVGDCFYALTVTGTYDPEWDLSP